MKRRTLLIGGGVLVVCVAVAAYFLFRPHDDDKAALALYGNIDIRDVNLGFRVSGRIAEVRLDEGDTVKAGDVLARLDPEPFEREVRESEGNAAATAAHLAMLKAGYRPEEVAQARAMRDERAATLANAARLLARQTELRGTGATSQKQYDDALAAKNEAAARLASADQALRQQRNGYRKEEIAEAGANLARADAALAQSRLHREDAVLRAPSDGVILTRVIEPGAILASGGSAFTLSLTRPVWARVYVSGPDLGRIAQGTRVQVYTDARPNQPYDGQIGYVSPTAEFTPKSVETPDLRTSLVYRARVIVENPDNALRQGMPVTVRVAAVESAQRKVSAR